jgi:GT2 family glycosyltransferase
VVTWNNYAGTAECLDSLLDLTYPNVEIVLVDNGSTDGSAARLEAEFPSVDVIHTGENLGYAGGVNVGTRAVLDRDVDYVWQSNNDVIVPDDSLLTDLVETIAANEDIGMLTPLVREYPSTETVWFWKGLLNWTTGETSHPEPPDTVSEGLVYSDFIPNCSLLFPSHVLEEVGLLPEEYFLYFDDVEHGVRIAAAGYQLATDPSTEIYHKESKSSMGELGPMYSYNKSPNTLLFADRFQDHLDGYLPVYLAMWMIEQVGIRLYHWELSGVRGIIEGVIDGLSGVTGQNRYP